MTNTNREDTNMTTPQTSTSATCDFCEAPTTNADTGGGIHCCDDCATTPATRRPTKKQQQEWAALREQYPADPVFPDGQPFAARVRELATDLDITQQDAQDIAEGELEGHGVEAPKLTPSAQAQRQLLDLAERTLRAQLKRPYPGEPRLGFVLTTDHSEGTVTALVGANFVSATVTLPTELDRLKHLHTCWVLYTQDDGNSDLTAAEAKLAARLISAAAHTADLCEAASRNN